MPGSRPGVGPTAVASRPRRGLVTAAVLAVGAVLLTVGWVARRPAPVGDRTVGQVTRVGVLPGDSLPGYAAAARAELAGLTAGAYALVSFDRYLAPDRLPALLADVEVAAVVVRVPLPGRQTEVVRLPAQLLPQDVTAGMAGLADRKDREAADQRRRAADTTDPTTRQGYETGAQVAGREAAGYRAACACVYAAVIRADPTALRAVAGRDGVRALDPAPEVARLDRTVFLPPLPEQRDVARPPADTAATPAHPTSTGPVPTPGGAMGDSSEGAPAVIAPAPSSSGAGPGSAATPVPTSPDSRSGGSSDRSP
ncbi:hypothetical protein [Micromonospora antibiotica]|uniref:Uncharacterized protein n=1 Tax=Micromonospora antibiotica TaxID=2807623 RepID=A0ABS3VEW4_9ACTN|nr:hypothetical protein [Micromonospora antibiotica]MBO4164171.1 hypothetical protein [Micromonospora antibiotica]